MANLKKETERKEEEKIRGMRRESPRESPNGMGWDLVEQREMTFNTQTHEMGTATHLLAFAAPTTQTSRYLSLGIVFPSWYSCYRIFPSRSLNRSYSSHNLDFFLLLPNQSVRLKPYSL